MEIAGPLLPRGISVVRGLLPGEAGAPVARRCEALRPPMDRLRRLAAARPRSAGALRVEVAATLSPERLPELPILLLAVGPLKPRALRIRFDGPVPEGLLPAVVEALRCTAVEGRRLRCGLFVGGSGAISPALSVGPQAVEALGPAGSPDPGDGLIWRASPSP